ncbi:MAG: helix-turn-helix domain-containing protein [Gaiellales bacterium]
MAIAPSEIPLRRRLPAEQRRALILEVARTLFARNGFHATGTHEIAAAAGCSEPIIYKHFASKQALFAAVLEDCALEVRGLLEQALAEHEDPLAAYGTFARRLVSEPRLIEITRLRTLALSLVHEPVIHETLLRVSEMMRGRWARILEQGQRLGTVRSDIVAEDVCLLGLGVSLTAGYLQAIGGDAALAQLPHMLDTMIALLRPPNREGGDPV